MRSSRSGTTILLLLATVAATGAVADTPAVVDVVVYAQDGWLRADITLRDVIDARTASTIDSGLSGVCAYEVAIQRRDGRTLGRRVWTYRLDYDLWADRYVLHGPDGQREMPSLAAMDSVCTHLTGVDLAPLSQLAPDAAYRLAVTVEVLPLGAEDRDRLSRYVSRRGDRDREDVDLDLGSLFGELFGGGSGAATGTYTGPAFRPDDLERRP